MASSSKERASTVSTIASFMYFIIIIFQIPLFRVQCGGGICTTPVEVVSCHLIRSEFVPAVVVKALLYPGALAKAIIKGGDLPSHNKVLKLYNFDNAKTASFATDLQHLEVLGGSYMCVVGAFFSLLIPRRISFIGTLLVFWGLIRESILIESKAVRIYPMMFLAAVSAFLSIRRDVRKIIRSCKSKPTAKFL